MGLSLRRVDLERFDRALRLCRHVGRMHVHRNSGTREPKHHVIAVEQFLD